LNSIVGIDIGGTNLVVGCVAEDGSRLEGLVSRPTLSPEGADKVMERLAGQIRDSMERTGTADSAASFVGAGVGCPGPLDRLTGTVLLTPNLGWHNYPVRQKLSQTLKLPTAIDNDANCAVLGEWWQGAARGTRHALGVTLGTGIGGGIIADGALYHGYGDSAGELGHTTIDADGRQCKCGNYGCLEAYASGSAIARRAVEAIEAGETSSLGEYVGGDLGKIESRTVFEAAVDGDELAREVVRDTARLLGAGIANFVNIFNPEIVVLCGGVTAAGATLFDPLRREVRRRAFRPAAEACRIMPGELTGTAGVYGAAKAFLDQQQAGMLEALDG